MNKSNRTFTIENEITGETLNFVIEEKDEVVHKYRQFLYDSFEEDDIKMLFSAYDKEIERNAVVNRLMNVLDKSKPLFTINIAAKQLGAGEKFLNVAYAGITYIQDIIEDEDLLDTKACLEVIEAEITHIETFKKRLAGIRTMKQAKSNFNNVMDEMFETFERVNYVGDFYLNILNNLYWLCVARGFNIKFNTETLEMENLEDKRDMVFVDIDVPIDISEDGEDRGAKVAENLYKKKFFDYLPKKDTLFVINNNTDDTVYFLDVMYKDEGLEVKAIASPYDLLKIAVMTVGMNDEYESLFFTHSNTGSGEGFCNEHSFRMVNILNTMLPMLQAMKTTKDEVKIDVILKNKGVHIRDLETVEDMAYENKDFITIKREVTRRLEED